MGKIYGICDFRRGKIGDLVFRKVADKNIVSEKANYYPVNSAWLKKQEFKNYVLSLLNEGIPQVYVLNELPEEIYPYALIFIQNQGGISIYVDKDGVRTEIKLDGESSDAVDIVNNVPGNPRNNTIYFVNNPESKNKNISEYDLYVCDNNELKQITLKGEDNPYITEAVNNLTSKSLKDVYNQVLPANKNVITDSNGYLTTGNLPKLYCHKWLGVHDSHNMVAATFYRTNNTPINGNNVYDILEGLGCDNYIHYYPATGVYMVGSGSTAKHFPVVGIFCGFYSPGVRGAMWTYISNSGLQSINPVSIKPTFTDTIMEM